MAIVPIGGLLALVLLLRRNRSAAAAERFGVTWKAAADGFFFMAPPRLRGARIFYRVSSGGRPVPAFLVLDGSPSGQFVYTGSQPSRVDIERVELEGSPHGQADFQSPAGAGAGYRDDGTYGSTGHLHHHNEPFGGFPSAY